MAKKLETKHILDAGGIPYTDEFKTDWIDIIPAEESRSKLKFFEVPEQGFNVYVQDIEGSRIKGLKDAYYDCVQFTFITTLKQFKILLKAFNNGSESN